MIKPILVAVLVLSSCDSNGASTSAPPETPAGDENEPEGTVAEEGDEAATAADGEDAPPVEVGDASAADTAAFAGSTRAFAADLWQRLRTREGNVAVSPASISTALAMTWAGARGETATQMATTMHFGSDAAAMHRAAHAQLSSWNDPDRETYELRVANRLFAQRGTPLEAEFVGLTRDAYGAPIELLDFRGDADGSRRHINGWVEDQTNERIQELLPSGALTSLTRLVLTNAVYFHGTWQHRFPEEATADAPFHRQGAAAVSVPTMRITESFGYAQSGDVTLLEMPYEGGELSMIIALPNARDGLGAVEQSLDAARLEAWASAPRPRRVNVLLPRFRIDPPEAIVLKETLQQMGMTLPFTPAADFTAMSNPPDAAERLYIDNVYHKAFVEVNEEGTEAAAATAVVMRVRGAAPAAEPTPTFQADHPFLFFLRDVRSGAILFMGRVTDPS